MLHTPMKPVLSGFHGDGRSSRELVVLEVVLDRGEDLAALFVDDDLPDFDDAGARAGDHRARRDVAVIGAG